MMPPDEVSIGELARRMDSLDASRHRQIDALERRIDDAFKAMSAKIEQLSFVHVDRYDAELRNTERRLASIENTSRWLARAIAGALITSTFAAVLLFLDTRGGG